MLVNARYDKNVPGRKSDINDVQWLQKLHSHGLLRASFMPDEQLAALRSYVRQRDMLVRRIRSGGGTSTKTPVIAMGLWIFRMIVHRPRRGSGGYERATSAFREPPESYG